MHTCERPRVSNGVNFSALTMPLGAALSSAALFAEISHRADMISHPIPNRTSGRVELSAGAWIPQLCLYVGRRSAPEDRDRTRSDMGNACNSTQGDYLSSKRQSYMLLRRVVSKPSPSNSSSERDNTETTRRDRRA